MKSAKEESTGYTDTSFMKPSLIYFPIIRTISRIVSKFRSSSHSLATFHESDILRGIKQNVNEQNVSVKQARLQISELRSTSSTSEKKQNVHKTYTARTIAHTLRRAAWAFF